MKVYIVRSSLDYMSTEVEACFDSFVKAREFCNKKIDDSDIYIEIIECELNTENIKKDTVVIRNGKGAIECRW